MAGEPDFELLLKFAAEARENGYAPYSKFKVGAALLGEDGEIYKGCNVENVSFGATNCAERTALFSAVAKGVRKFRAIAVIADLPTPITPCGICRQVLAEFNPDMDVLCANTKGDIMRMKVRDLLPSGFDSFNGSD